jgi:two-component system LytT family response regulator
MNIVILEDEQRNYNRLKRILEEIDSSFVIEGPLTGIAEAVDYFRQHPEPDLVLADIRLSDGLSFEALRQSAVSSPVIFTTAYDEYAIQAFKYNSFDYLLKPVDKEELHAAISKVCRMGQKIQNDEMRQLLDLMKRNNYRYRERFLLPYRDGYKSVLVKDINHISLEERNSCLFYNDGTSDVVPYTMDELEAQLDPRSFFRANRQFIIHIDHVKSISNYFNSRLCVHLKGFPDVTVNVSRERAAALKEWMDS